MTDITRRQILAGAGALAVGMASDAAAKSHEGHEAHTGHAAGNDKHRSLVAAALGCIGEGETCLEHCLQAFKTGDTKLADCAASVQNMLPVCTAMVRLATSGSPRLPALSRVCADVCRDCETECRKHQDMHAACKSCAEACARLIKACEAVAA